MAAGAHHAGPGLGCHRIGGVTGGLLGEGRASGEPKRMPEAEIGSKSAWCVTFSPKSRLAVDLSSFSMPKHFVFKVLSLFAFLSAGEADQP